jgi:tetratricopeptide (TPR) repeat protein
MAVKLFVGIALGLLITAVVCTELVDVCSTQECFEVHAATGSPLALLRLGQHIGRDGSAMLDGEVVNSTVLFLRVLNGGETGLHAQAWRGVSRNLIGSEKISVNGSAYDKKATLLRALSLGAVDAGSWFDLGTLLPDKGRAAVPAASDDGEAREVTKAECFANSLALNRTHSLSWYYLGNELAPQQTIAVGEEAAVTKADCFANALELEDTILVYWGSLGSALGQSERREVRGVEVGRKECFQRVLELDDTHAIAWLNLGGSIGTTPGETAEVKGKRYTPIECFARCLQQNPRIAGAWFNLGMVLPPGESYQVQEGIEEAFVKDRTQCFVRAVTVNPKIAPAWYALGDSLGTAEARATIMGAKRDRVHCFARAAELDPRNGTIWRKLAASLGDDATVKVSGHELTKAACEAKADASTA